jgi:hypothetical protein
VIHQVLGWLPVLQARIRERPADEGPLTAVKEALFRPTTWWRHETGTAVVVQRWAAGRAPWRVWKTWHSLVKPRELNPFARKRGRKERRE